MAIKLYSTLTKDGIKKFKGLGSKVIVYNAKKEIVFESDDNFVGTVSTPSTNIVKHGTESEVVAEKTRLSLKLISEVSPIILTKG